MNDFPFESNFVRLPAGNLHYIDEGKGPVLLLLHGNPTWSFFWRRLIQGLKHEYRVIAVDHMGCGYSDRPEHFSYTLENHINNVSAFIDALSLPPFFLGVHDWGGPIGLGFATENPEHIRGLVILNTAAFIKTPIPFRLKLARTPVIGKLLIQGGNAFVRGLTHFASVKPLSSETRKGYLKPYDTYRNRVATYEFVKDIPLSEGDTSWNRLKRIEERLAVLKDKPATFIWGEHDWVFHPGFLKDFKERLPNAEAHLLSEAGHLVLEDAPERSLRIVSEFLARHA